MSEPISLAEQGPNDLPTGEPIPAAPAPAPTATPSSSSKPEESSAAPAPASSKPSTARLLPLLLALPTKTDAFITHLQRALSTPGGIDTVLLFLCYSARLTGALATSASHALLNRTFVALALTLPRQSPSNPATVILATKATTALTPRRAALASLAALLGARLKALGGLASEARTIARLWALLNMYSWAKRLLNRPADASVSAAAKIIDWTQLVACTAFQALENGAYLSSRNILAWTPAEQGRAYVLASRWLAVYTGLEIGKLLATILAARRKGGAPVEEKKSEEEERIAAVAVRRSLAINLAWTPLTLHWAANTGFLSDLAVGLGGCVPGVLQMRKLWAETAL